MRILHSADWHLGHLLHGFSRSEEHALFLTWLSELIHEQQIDCLLVAGDLFDTANPPASSWQQLYGFLADIAKANPALNVVLTGGNHDSPSKLDAPHELLKAFNLHMVGSITRDSEGKIESERLLVPLTNSTGEISAWCMAVPFLRSADLRIAQELEEGQDRLIEGVRQLYGDLYQQALEKAQRKPVLAMGHAYMVSGELSELSERKVLGGNQHALPADIFHSDISYVALGHLHLAQKIAGKEHIRYSGAPLPLSINEKNYPHQVSLITLADDGSCQIDKIKVPQHRVLLCVPEQAEPLEQVVEKLGNLEVSTDHSIMPLLEVRVLLDKPQALLREQILEALKGKPVQLAKISTSYSGNNQSMADRVSLSLDTLAPEQVFELCYQRQFDGEPSEQMKQAFSSVMQSIEDVAK